MKTSLLVLIVACATAAVSLSRDKTQRKNQQQAFSNVTSKRRPARLPATNPTRSFWTDSSADANPLAFEGSTGPLTSDADVCIIGSGMTGVSVAYHLSEAMRTNVSESPLKVVILEARDFCAGATGRNFGNLTPDTFSGFFARANKYGPEEAKRSYALEAYTTSSLVHLIQEHGWENDISLVHGGNICPLFSDQEVKAVRRDCQAAVDAGWSLDGVVELNEEELEATIGMRYPAVKYPGYRLSPPRLVTKLYQLTKSRTSLNLSLHTHTPVTAIDRANPASESSANSSANTTRPYALVTHRGTIACSRIVHATDAHASHLLPFLAGPEGIIPVRGQVMVTHASVGMSQIKTSNWSVLLNSVGWFAPPVTNADGKALIIVGGAREAAGPGMETDVDDDSNCHPRVGRTLRRILRALLKGRSSSTLEPEMEWTGIKGHTAEDPFVGPVDRFPAARLEGTDVGKYAGQFVAAGYSGHGMPRAFGCAEVVAQMIVSERTGTAWTQPEWLPTRYLTWEERGITTRD